jgi:hypothetical protein
MDAENPLIDIEVVDYDEYDLEEKEDTGDIETDIITTGVFRCNEFNSDCDGCDECDECESQDFGHVITDRINLVMEMFNDSDVCDDCKFEALVDLVLLGVDGALQGCIGRKEDKIEYQIRVLLGERTKHF